MKRLIFCLALLFSTLFLQIGCPSYAQRFSDAASCFNALFPDLHGGFHTPEQLSLAHEIAKHLQMPELDAYADSCATNFIDRGDAKGISLMKALLARAEQSCGRNSEAAIRMRNMLAVAYLATDKKEAQRLAKENVESATKGLKVHPHDTIYKSLALLTRLDQLKICYDEHTDSPYFWQEVYALEKELDAFCTEHPADCYEKALMYQCMGALKQQNTLNPDYLLYLYHQTFPNGTRIPSVELTNGTFSNAEAYINACYDIMKRLFGSNDVRTMCVEVDVLSMKAQQGAEVADEAYLSLLNLQHEMLQYAHPDDIIFQDINLALWECCIASKKRLYKLTEYPNLLRHVADYYGTDSEAYLGYLRNVYYQQILCNLKDARSIADKIESLGSRIYADRPEEILSIYIDLFSLFQAEGDYNALETHLQKCIDFYEAHHEPTWVSIYWGRNLANMLSFAAGRTEDGIRVAKSVLSDEEILGGIKSPALPFSLSNLTQTAAHNKDVRTVISTQTRAIHLAQQMHKHIGYFYAVYVVMLEQLLQTEELIKVCRNGISATKKSGETLWRHFLQLRYAQALLNNSPAQTKKALFLFEESVPYFLNHIDQLHPFMFRGFFSIESYYIIKEDDNSACKTLQQGMDEYYARTGSYDGIMIGFVDELFNYYVNYKNDYDAAELLMEGHVQRIRSNPSYIEHEAVCDFLQKHLSLLHIKSPNDWLKRYAIAKDLQNELNCLIALLPEADVWTRLSYWEPILNELGDLLPYMAPNTIMFSAEEMSSLPSEMRELYQQTLEKARTQMQAVYSTFQDLMNDLREEPDYLQKGLYESLVSFMASYHMNINHDYNAAIETIKELTISNNQNIRARAYIDLSNLYLILRQNEQAYQSIKHAIDCMGQRNFTHTTSNKTMCLLEDTHFEAALLTGRLNEALQSARSFQTYQRALLNENLDLMTVQERELFIQKLGSSGVFLQDLLPHMPDSVAAEAYNSILEDKGLLLRASERNRRAIMENADATLLTQIDSLNQMRNELLRAQVSIDKQTGAWSYQQETAELSQDIANLERNIYRKVHRHLSESETTPTWHNVQQCLQEQEAAIEYVFSQNQTGALVVLPKAERPIYVPLCMGDSLYARFFNLGELEPKHRAERLYERDELNLYDSLWSAIEPVLKNVKRVYFSPTGFINMINLSAIRCPDGKPLCEHYELYQLTSTAQLVQKKKTVMPKDVTLVGEVYYSPEQEQDDLYYRSISSSQKSPEKRAALKEAFGFLPFTVHELQAIQSSFESKHIKTKILKGDLATETALRSLSGNSPSVLHLATHGFFIEKIQEVMTNKYLAQFPLFREHPMQRAGMALTGANATWNEGCSTPNADGIISAAEVATLDFSNTRLAVLSACETGVGGFDQEGVFGMYRGFKQAGVTSIMASLWQVSDESTSLLMKHFYEGWLGGKSMHQAHLDALRYIREHYPSPYHWASFVLIDVLP